MAASNDPAARFTAASRLLGQVEAQLAELGCGDQWGGAAAQSYAVQADVLQQLARQMVDTDNVMRKLLHEHGKQVGDARNELNAWMAFLFGCVPVAVALEAEGLWAESISFQTLVSGAAISRCTIVQSLVVEHAETTAVGVQAATGRYHEISSQIAASGFAASPGSDPVVPSRYQPGTTLTGSTNDADDDLLEEPSRPYLSGPRRTHAVSHNADAPVSRGSAGPAASPSDSQSESDIAGSDNAAGSQAPAGLAAPQPPDGAPAAARAPRFRDGIGARHAAHLTIGQPVGDGDGDESQNAADADSGQELVEQAQTGEGPAVGSAGGLGVPGLGKPPRSATSERQRGQVASTAGGDDPDAGVDDQCESASVELSDVVDAPEIAAADPQAETAAELGVPRELVVSPTGSDGHRGGPDHVPAERAPGAESALVAEQEGDISDTNGAASGSAVRRRVPIRPSGNVPVVTGAPS